MGLDMYLRAERSFEPESGAAKLLIAKANDFAATEGSCCDDKPLTMERLVAMAEAEEGDPYYGRSFYLGWWDHMGHPEVKAKALGIVTSAGLADFTTEAAPSGGLLARDGKLVVQVTCVYWRKANAVHAWFVEKVQDGIDDCQLSPLTAERLRGLREECADAVAEYAAGNIEKATELVPPRAGFFFGGTEPDEYYLRSLERTVSELDRVLALAAADGNVDFAYQASW